MRFSAACDTAAAGTASSAATAAALSHRSMVGFPLHHLQSSLSRSLVQGRRGRFNPGLYDGDLQMKKPAPDRLPGALSDRFMKVLYDLVSRMRCSAPLAACS